MTRILIVDDSEQNLYLLQVLLTGHGYEVESAANGTEALEVARRNPPDLIITDILMPGMDGFALCREWKRDAKLQQIPFVFYTATYTDAKDREFALSLGAERFIVKPTEPDLFIEIIRQVLKNHAAGRLAASRKAVEEEEVFFKQYNEALIRKLEDKMLQLEETNRALERDIAERERAEEALRESERRFRDLFEGIPASCWAVDQEGTILYWNRAAEELYGWTAEQAIGHTMYELMVKDENVVPTREKIAAVFQGQSFRGIEYENRRADGTTCSVLVNEYPLRDTSGRVIMAVCAGLDISERKRLEEQLRQAQKMEALGRLAGGVAHDFNNLLTVIRISSQMLEGQLHRQDPLWENVRQIREAGERATTLTRQLLSFSRQEIIKPQTLDLNQVVGNLSGMLRRIIGEEIQLVTALEDGLWPVHIDPTQVEQLIMNLVVNARDAMPQSGTLTIETANVVLDEDEAARHVDARPGEQVLLAISDTGLGMDEEVKARIFEPFFTTKEEGKGTGLGLSIVYGIVKQSHGHIRVHSQVGQGTTFRIYLPCSANSLQQP